MVHLLNVESLPKSNHKLNHFICTLIAAFLFLFDVLSLPLSKLIKDYNAYWMQYTLRSCRTEVCRALGIPENQCELSMGMSGDFEQAVSPILTHG